MVEKEGITSTAEDRSYEVSKGTIPKRYSPKLGGYVSLNSGKPQGEMQEYNIGIGPGTWY
ncbi:MAG TPA: hypothetical protein VJH92_04035 [Candidatus Nanoarchaeia archaeon]|nr:hypothetical protein [Candidatus Nanoarchaeia archaeon]